MRSLLRRFDWGKFSAQDYIEALQSTSREVSGGFKPYFERAIMLCLNILRKTGMGRKENLLAFTSSKCTPKPELATLLVKEHSWIRILKDTATECCIVALGDTCLEFKHSLGVSCGSSGRSVLGTQLVLNQRGAPLLAVLKSAKTHQTILWSKYWDTTSMKIGTQICKHSPFVKKRDILVRSSNLKWYQRLTSRN